VGSGNIACYDWRINSEFSIYLLRDCYPRRRADRMYIFETRSTAAVGKMYDEAYRHAAGKRKSGGMGQNMARLKPTENWGMKPVLIADYFLANN
jgi:hypothetical protein